MPTARSAFASPTPTARARRGVMTTAHGDVETPAFMPVGTQGAVKGRHAPRSRGDRRRDPAEQHLSSLSASRRRSHRAPRRAAPVHRLDRSRSSPTAAAIRCSAWPSAGRSTRRACTSSRTSTGRAHLLTPEKATDIQAQLGSDIAMVLDECLALSGRRRGGARRRWSGRSRWARRARERAARDSRRGPVGGVIVTNPARRSSASCRAASFRSCGARARADGRASASRRTRSAG